MEMRERGENEQIISFVVPRMCVLVLNGDNNIKKKFYILLFNITKGEEISINVSLSGLVREYVNWSEQLWNTIRREWSINLMI